MTNLDSKTSQTGHNTTNREIRTLIQEISTRRYFSAGGDWTSVREKATAFPSVSAAMEHMRQLQFVMVQLVSNGNTSICEVIQATQIGADGWSKWLARSPQKISPSADRLEKILGR